MTNPLTLNDLDALFSADFLNAIQSNQQYSKQAFLDEINKSQTLLGLLDSFKKSTPRIIVDPVIGRGTRYDPSSNQILVDPGIIASQGLDFLITGLAHELGHAVRPNGYNKGTDLLSSKTTTAAVGKFLRAEGVALLAEYQVAQELGGQKKMSSDPDGILTAQLDALDKTQPNYIDQAVLAGAKFYADRPASTHSNLTYTQLAIIYYFAAKQGKGESDIDWPSVANTIHIQGQFGGPYTVTGTIPLTNGRPPINIPLQKSSLSDLFIDVDNSNYETLTFSDGATNAKQINADGSLTVTSNAGNQTLVVTYATGATGNITGVSSLSLNGVAQTGSLGAFITTTLAPIEAAAQASQQTATQALLALEQSAIYGGNVSNVPANLQPLVSTDMQIATNFTAAANQAQTDVNTNANIFDYGNSGTNNFGHGNIGNNNNGNNNIGSNNAGNNNYGNGNSGDNNNGSNNIGYNNTGSYNVGSYDVGNYNSGSHDNGSYNNGDYDNGNYNVGSGNSGDNNVGDANVGSGNNGSYNIGSNNNGWYNNGTGNNGSYNNGNYDNGNYDLGDSDNGSYNWGTGNNGSYNDGNNNNGNNNRGSNNQGSGNQGSGNHGNDNNGDNNFGNGNNGSSNNGNYINGSEQGWGGGGGLFGGLFNNIFGGFFNWSDPFDIINNVSNIVESVIENWGSIEGFLEVAGLLAAGPLVVSIDRQPIQLVSLGQSDAFFDITGDGTKIHTSWIGANAGFLILDPTGATPADGTGLIGSGYPPGQGFAALAALANSQSVVDASNPLYAQLRVWVPNATGSGGDVYTLAQLGIASIDVNAIAGSGGGPIAATGTLTYSDGTTGTIDDVTLTNQAAAVTLDGQSTPALAYLDRVLQALAAQAGGTAMAAGSTAAAARSVIAATDARLTVDVATPKPLLMGNWVDPALIYMITAGGSSPYTVIAPGVAHAVGEASIGAIDAVETASQDFQAAVGDQTRSELAAMVANIEGAPLGSLDDMIATSAAAVTEGAWQTAFAAIVAADQALASTQAFLAGVQDVVATGIVPVGWDYWSPQDAQEAADSLAEEAAAARSIAVAEAALQTLLPAAAQAWNAGQATLALDGTSTVAAGGDLIISAAGAETIASAATPSTFAILQGSTVSITGFLPGEGGSVLDFLDQSGVATIEQVGSDLQIGVGTAVVTLVGVSQDQLSWATNIVGVGTLSFAQSTQGVDFSLGSATGTFDDGNTHFVAVIGTPFDDMLVGSQRGSILVGGAGNNVLDGGNGYATVDYSAAPGGVSVNLATGTAANGYGGTDTLIDIASVIGSAFSDTIVGGRTGDVLNGGAGGNDTLIAGPGDEILIGGTTGNDTLVAGTGNDTLVSGGGPTTMVVGPGDGTTLIVGFKAGDTLSMTVGADSTLTMAPLGQQVVEENAAGVVTVVNGDGTQVAWGQAGTGWQATVASGGDGKSEILWDAPTTGVNADYYLWTAGPNGGTPTQTKIFTGGTKSDWIGSGDFDGNGSTDFLAYNASLGSLYMLEMSGTTLSGSGYLTNNGTPISIPVNWDWAPVAVGDFNGDGRSDVLFVNSTTHDTGVWTMNGLTATSMPVLGTPAPAGAVVLGTGDFTGDGKADVVWENTSTGVVTLWSMNGGSVAWTSTLGTVDTSWTYAGINKVNGVESIAWQTTDGRVVEWFGGTSATTVTVNSGSSIAGALGVGNFTDGITLTYGSGSHVDLLGVSPGALTASLSFASGSGSTLVENIQTGTPSSSTEGNSDTVSVPSGWVSLTTRVDANGELVERSGVRTDGSTWDDTFVGGLLSVREEGAGNDVMASTFLNGQRMTRGWLSRTTYFDWNGDVLEQTAVLLNGTTVTDEEDGAGRDLEVRPALSEGVGVAGLSGMLIKTAATGWGNAGASSAQSFTGSGYVEFTASETTTARMVALTKVDTDAGYASLDFAIDLDGNALYVYEDGVLRAAGVPYATGDKIRIERQATGTIVYSKNGVEFYVSQTQSTAELRVDTALYQTGATLAGVVLSIGGATAKPIDWVKDVGVAEGRLAASATTTLADVGGVGQTEAVVAAADGRLWVRESRADGTFGDAIAQGTGIGGLFGNVLRKMTSSTGWGDSGASSEQSFTGEGYVETVIAETNSSRLLGLSNTDINARYVSIAFSVSLGSDGYVYVYESGVSKGQFGTYQSGDTFRVERLSDGHVVYSKNGTVFYTSTTQSTAELRVDASFYTPGTTLKDVVLSTGGAAATAVDWVNDVGVAQGPLTQGATTHLADVNGDGRLDAVLSTADGQIWVREGKADGTFGGAMAQGLGLSDLGGELRKTTAVAEWGDSGASSAQTFTGAGYVETTAGETTTNRLIGLSNVDADASPFTIGYAIYLIPDGWLQIFENGVQQGLQYGFYIGSYTTGDVFRVERLANGQVVYKKNGVVFFTSSTLSTGEVRVDTSLYQPGATLQNVVVSAGGSAPTPVQWVNATGVEEGHLAQNVKTTFADVNGDGRADALLTAADGRLWVRKANADGSFGDAVAPVVGIDGLNSLRKTSGTVGWESGASSSQAFTGAGYSQTVLAETNTYRMFGLSDADSDASYASLDYAVFVRADGLLDVYENGVFRGEFTTYASGDILRIERLADGHVVYEKNGTIFYTGATVSTAALHIDTSFYSPGATLQNVTMSSNGGPAEPVEWTNNVGVAVGTLGVAVTTTLGDINGDGRVDAVQATPDGRLWVLSGQADGSLSDALEMGTGIDALNVLRKTSNASVWGDAGASSAQSFTGAGYVETVAGETTTFRMIGLSSAADTDAGWSSISYALYLIHDGWLQIYENGVQQGTQYGFYIGSYTTGDTFRVERLANGQVVYKKNGVVFYTSATLSTGELHVDTTLYTPGATLNGVVMTTSNETVVPVQWINEVGVSVDGHLAQSVTTSLADVNGDGRMDAVLAASDGRLWVRQGNADGTLGGAVALGDAIDGLNALQKTSGTTNWDSGASSSQSFTGVGYVETTAAETNSHRMIGLSSADGSASYASIDYAAYLAADGGIYIYENGLSRGLVGSYAAGDTIRVERLVNGHVVYEKNGTVLYTSTIASTGELRVDTAFLSPGATLQDVVLSVNGSTAQPVQWDNEVGVAVGDMGLAITTTLGDINGDDRSDAVQTTADGRLWLRLGQTDGSFGDAVPYGTGIDALNSLYKRSGVSAWDSGASSVQTFAGEGYVETKASETNTWKIFGLSTSDIDAGYASISYAVELGADDQIYIFENGVFRGTAGTYATGDTFRVERRADGHVVYEKNGTVLYTSLVLSSGSLRADSSLYTPGASLVGTTLSAGGGPVTPVTWINQIGVIEGGSLGQGVTTSLGDVNGDGLMDVVQMASDGRLWIREGQANGALGATIALGSGVGGPNDLSKTGATGWNAGASSAQSFTGSGYVEITASETTTARMFALTKVDSDAGFSSLDYAIDLDGNALYVYEDSVLRASAIPYATGDKIRIERQADGAIVYSKNGAAFYTSTTKSTAELRVDTSLYQTGATLTDAVLSVGGAVAKPVDWVNDVGVAVGGVGSSLTMSLADVNGDGKADIVVTAADGRVWTTSTIDAITNATGAQTWVVTRGDGNEVVNGAADNGNDVIAFQGNISHDQLWLSRSNDDLVVSVIGQNQAVTVTDWYASSNNHVREITAGDGYVVGDTGAQQLVAAMASFSQPASGQTTLSTSLAQSLGPALAANWQHA